MKKLNSKFLHIKSTIWPGDVIITKATDDEVIKYLEKDGGRKLDDEAKRKISIKTTGHTSQFESGSILVRLNPEMKELDIPVLVHELFHAVSFTMDFAGVHLTDGSDEAYAYYLGYLTQRSLEFFNH